AKLDAEFRGRIKAALGVDIPKGARNELGARSVAAFTGFDGERDGEINSSGMTGDGINLLVPHGADPHLQAAAIFPAEIQKRAQDREADLAFPVGDDVVNAFTAE